MARSVDWRPLYPFASHYLDVGGQRMHYVDEGEGDALLLVHGNPTWSFYWRELIKAWRGRFRVIAADHIGCGLSGKPGDYEYRLGRHIDNLRRLIDHLQLDRTTLVAHDWGGAIGMGAAVAEPDKFGRLVLMNTAAFRVAKMPWRIRVCRTPVFGRLAVQGANGFARAALWMAAERRERLTPAVRAGLLAPYDSWANRVAIHQFVMDIPMNSRHPSWRTLSQLEQGLERLRDRPVQLIWGMRDWCFTPALIDRFQEFFPHAEAHRIADAGHYVVEDAHERIAPLVEQFVDSHPIAAPNSALPADPAAERQSAR